MQYSGCGSSFNTGNEAPPPFPPTFPTNIRNAWGKCSNTSNDRAWFSKHYVIFVLPRVPWDILTKRKCSIVFISRFLWNITDILEARYRRDRNMFFGHSTYLSESFTTGSEFDILFCVRRHFILPRLRLSNEFQDIKCKKKKSVSLVDKWYEALNGCIKAREKLQQTHLPNIHANDRARTRMKRKTGKLWKSVPC